MSYELARQAAACLEILNISLGPHAVRMPNGFNPLEEIDQSFINLQWGPRQAQLGDAARVGEEGSDVIWRVWYRTSARYVRGQANEIESKKIAEDAIIATLEADFLLQYRVTTPERPTDVALREFAVHNIAVQVWPYWREWLQSECMRTGLPVHVLQFMLPKAAAQSD